jgi:hypothetical protein
VRYAAFISWHLLPQNSDFDAGSIAVLIPTKHNMAKTNPATNTGAILLTGRHHFLLFVCRDFIIR